MKKLSRSLFAASFVSLGIVEPASAQPADVRLEGVSHSGSGCPIGTVDMVLSPGRDTVSLDFDALVAKTAPPLTLDGKNCQIVLDIRFDPAWSFAISRVDHRGFAVLEAGVLGQQRSTYFFAGMAPASDAVAMTSIVGPFFGNYSRSNNVDPLVWSPCGGRNYPLIINTEVRVQGSPGLMIAELATRRVTQAYDLRWKKCS